MSQIRDDIIQGTKTTSHINTQTLPLLSECVDYGMP